MYYVARRDFAEQKPEVVAELQEQLQRVALWVKNDPLGAAERMAPGLGLSPRALVASLQRELDSLVVSEAQIAAQQQMADALLRLQLIPRRVSVADAQWGRRWQPRPLLQQQPSAALLLQQQPVRADQSFRP